MIESALWVAFGLALPWLARHLLDRVSDPTGQAPPDVAWMAKAAYGTLPPFGAWVSGALVGREMGLGAPWSREALPVVAVLSAALIIAEGAIQRWETRPGLHRMIGDGRGLTDLFDTPRWAMYRAAGWLWTGNPALGGFLGLLAMIVESLSRSGRPPNLRLGRDRGELIWMIGTMIFLGVSGNLWLTLAAQAGVLWLARATQTSNPADA